MSPRGKGVVLAVLCAFLAVVVALPTEAKEAKKEPRPRVTTVKVDTSASYSAIFEGGESGTEASCSVSCGNGTGYICTGASVYCADGVGCTATTGSHMVGGNCQAT
jgi:hypothetical protein